jgi:Nickel responsive protein SCO4226-like
MARFMDVHRGFKGATREQLEKEHRKDQQFEKAEGVHFERSWVDPSSGMAFCLSEGPSKEAVLKVHEKAGHPTTEIYEVPIDIS